MQYKWVSVLNSGIILENGEYTPGVYLFMNFPKDFWTEESCLDYLKKKPFGSDKWLRVQDKEKTYYSWALRE